MSWIGCVHHFLFDLSAQRCKVSCGGRQKLHRKCLPWQWRRWATEVLYSLNRLITFILICCVRQGVGRGLTTQKGTRPSTSLFYGHILRLAVSVTETASETAVFDGGMYLLKPVLFFFFWIIYVVLDMQWCMQVLCIHNIWGYGWNGGKFCVCSSTPSPPQICSYFLTPKIFSLCLDRAKRSPLSSIILSHPAKAVALGGSVKNFISNHEYICLLSVVSGFSSSLFVWLYYDTLNPTLCVFWQDYWPVWCPSVIAQVLLLTGKFTF